MLPLLTLELNPIHIVYKQTTCIYCTSLNSFKLW